jgi:hypothetical protein
MQPGVIDLNLKPNSRRSRADGALARLTPATGLTLDGKQLANCPSAGASSNGGNRAGRRFLCVGGADI